LPDHKPFFRSFFFAVKWALEQTSNIFALRTVTVALPAPQFGTRSGVAGRVTGGNHGTRYTRWGAAAKSPANALADPLVKTAARLIGSTNSGAFSRKTRVGRARPILRPPVTRDSGGKIIDIGEWSGPVTTKSAGASKKKKNHIGPSRYVLLGKTLRAGRMIFRNQTRRRFEALSRPRDDGGRRFSSVVSVGPGRRFFAGYRT